MKAILGSIAGAICTLNPGAETAALPGVLKGRLMKQVMTAIGRLALRNEGQDLMEYGILAALIAVVAVASVTALGSTVNSVFWQGIGQAI